MLSEMHDKKPLTGSDHTDSAQNENIMPQPSNEMEEQDLDDLTHNSLKEEIPEGEEIDPDDVIHNATLATNPNLQSGTEGDPDDLVHGN